MRITLSHIGPHISYMWPGLEIAKVWRSFLHKRSNRLHVFWRAGLPGHRLLFSLHSDLNCRKMMHSQTPFDFAQGVHRPLGYFPGFGHGVVK